MDTFAHLLNESPLSGIAAALFIALLLARELGGWTHFRVAGPTDEPAEQASERGYILSAVLGLLALLIAFTFSLAVNRYEGRRHMVTSEANAIATAEMRVQLLPAPQGARLSQSLREYARTRLAYGQANAMQKPAVATRSVQQRAALQRETLAALRPVATTSLTPFVGASINSVLELGAERETLNNATVPATVVAALIFYTLLTAAILGYTLTGAKARHRPATVILFSLLVLAIALILDLDRPQRGTIRVDQTPMVQLVASFGPGASLRK